MTRRFIDAFYYMALLNPRDEDHARVVEYHAQLSGKAVTTEAVLLEVANAFGATRLRDKAAQLIRTERASPDTMAITVTSELFTRGLERYSTRRDKKWSLTDCISFVVMEDEGLTEALTADHHFEQAGFRAVFAEKAAR